MDKQYILEEIKRTAEANGGIPLGRGRFLEETGIREGDWSGRYWVRWADAIREAGLAPNRFGRTALDEDWAIERLASLIRELGRFPIQPELRIRKRQDASFPSDAWWRRYGGKIGLARRVLEFCEARPDLADVVAICGPLTSAPEKQPESSLDKQEPDFGYVYLIRSGKHHKIGRSNSAGRREYELAIQLPQKAQKVHEIRTDDPVGIEAYWHSRFAAKRKNGEWFELAAADIAAFKRRKFM